jgi:hypothetical protein
MIVRFASPADVEAICSRLRPSDLQEVMALRLEADIGAFTAQLVMGLQSAVLRITLAGDDGEAIAFVGLWLHGPGVGSANLIATDRWDEIAAPAHRFCKRVVIGRVAPSAFRRLECRTLASHAASRKWLRRLGFVEEGVCRALGRNGENFVQCAWVHPDHSPRQEV